MGKFIVRVLINALALWIASWVLPGLQVASSAATGLVKGNSAAGTALAFVFVGLIFGVVNALVKPIVKLLSLPVTFLTLGLFTIVINAAMLWLTSWLSSYTPVSFTIDSFFFTAILAAILISVISLIASAITGVGRRR
ncbi:phage holin family protein [Paenarthrobacter sp. Z7-10]|uniref:phage holin family protein n=1 Tax=Paenarthrobacter sp. Z7-10 TaxID=2787635 RepID=UPI0022A9DBAF|nr:phage holin family protein [Paenarthrobacter sp. Z7-10]MCZ2401666.1 phage holin family protein [Paenarthrobacter sp. Z7-10]